MRKETLVLITLILLVTNIFGQIKALVKDEITLKPIKYVNIYLENESIGISSDKDGYFSLNVDHKNKKLVLNAIGYQTKIINASEINETIYLKPKIVELPEIEVIAKRNSKELKIGSFKKSEINVYFGADSNYPWIVARLFEYNKEYNKTKFLKKIKIATGISKKTEFNVRLYSVGEDEKPNEYLVNENIIGIAKKGFNNTEIDLSHLNLMFPKDGLFIAIENIKTAPKESIRSKKNKSQKTFTVGLNLNSKKESTYIYHKGKWESKINSNNILKEKMLNLFKAIPIELTLTD